MKINSLVSPAFQKKIVAKCMVKKNDKPDPCFIYKLNRKEDKKYFINLSSSEDWQKAHYLKMADYILNNDRDAVCYAIENLKEDCIGYCITKEFNNIYSDSLLYIEVAPLCSSENKKRKTKYIGETLLTFLTEAVKRKNKEKLFVAYMAMRSRDFYIKKCGFRMRDAAKSEIKIDDFHLLEEQNIEHTGSKIEFVG